MDTNSTGDPDGAGRPLPDDALVPKVTGLRAALNSHRTISLVVLSAIIAASVVWIVWWSWPEPPQAPIVRKAFYTVDDGATLFVDEAEKLPPFDHGGKKAVQAFVFTCDDHKTRFVAYLRKLPEEALEKLVADGRDLKTVDDDEVAMKNGWLVKRPGDKEWVNSKAEPDKFRELQNVICPGGKGKVKAAFPDDSK